MISDCIQIIWIVFYPHNPYKPNDIIQDNESPLDYAVAKGHYEVALALLNKGANPNENRKVRS